MESRKSQLWSDNIQRDNIDRDTEGDVNKKERDIDEENTCLIAVLGWLKLQHI